MLLIAAVRVNVIEDLVNDLLRGRVPNLAKEMGLKSELKYNRAGVVRKAAVAALCVAAWMAYSRARQSRKMLS
jgi:hypothetical protein